MSKKTTFSIAGILSAAVIATSGITAMAADVDVYAEGAYTASDLVVYIYADINTDPLVSAGVKLTYDKSKFYPVDPDTDPVGAAPKATKNETDWYFGTAEAKYPYQDPQINTDLGEVVFINGKIDENAPIAGVTGTRKLIGTVKFTRVEGVSPGTSPETYFGIFLGLGITRPAPDQFANFVTAGEVVLDEVEVSYAVKILERGDASEDGVIDSRDITALKKNIGKTDLPVWFDCSGDGVVDSRDITCLKKII